MSLVDVQLRLLTLDEVAERLGVSRRTVQRKVAQGEIPRSSLAASGRQSALRPPSLRNGCVAHEGQRESATPSFDEGPFLRTPRVFFREDAA
jgi:excisionase family DNA binding protein